MLIHERFWARAQADPDRVAFVDRDGASLSYGEAARQVDNLARFLTGRLPPGTRVAINMRKSVRPIVVMLACLRAGLTYVPVDAASPLPRRRFIVEDSGSRALVLDEASAGEWRKDREALDGLDLILGPADGPETTEPADDPETAEPADGPETAERADLDEATSADGTAAPARSAEPDDLAYILYTSGSTGEPKGVQITHRNAAAFVEWAIEYTGLRPGDRVAVHAPLHFDLPVLDLYAGLASGAAVHPIDEKTALFPQALYRFLRDRRITVLYAVPSALIALRNRSGLAEDGLPDLRLLLYAGEEFHPGPLRRLVEVLPGTSVHNLYGPIETNVVTALEIRPEHLDRRRIPIGRPISGIRIFLVGEDGAVITEPEHEGEILVSGPSVTPGYLNRPERTAAARHRLRADGETFECHRTGDWATWDEDGILNFLGRRDGLVKTRGFRVELGEIEAILLDHPRVVEAAVIAVPDPDATNLLYGYVVGERGAEPDQSELAGWCRERLAPYMVPARIELRPDLPRTGTGKISRRSLRDEDADSAPAEQAAGPNPVEVRA
jgi:amino acid adenylation domain-containing protein